MKLIYDIKEEENMEYKHVFEAFTVNGKDYFGLQVERNSDGISLISLELKARIENIKTNIERCGSYEQLLLIGGIATREYMKNTRNLLRFYLFVSQVENLLLSQEDIRTATENVNAVQEEVHGYVRNADWDDLERFAQDMRASFVHDWNRRRLAG